MITGFRVFPCRFCGAGQEYLYVSVNVPSCVWCAKCGAHGPTGKDQEEAVSMWNSRTAVKEGGVRFDHLDVDEVLRIGREFQASDAFRGATFDTAKLLCDTIERLQEEIRSMKSNLEKIQED